MNDDSICDPAEDESLSLSSPQERYEQALKAMLEMVVGSNPYEMLAMLSLTNLAAFDGVSKEYSEPGALTAMHVEFLQAIALRFKLSEYTIKPPDLNAFKELVRVVSLNFTLLGMSDSLKQSSESPDLVAMRLYTQSIRNWAYPQEAFDIATLLFEPFNNDFRASTGLTATETIALLQAVIRWIEIRAKDAHQGLLHVMEAKRAEEVVQRYREKFEKELPSNRFESIDELKNYAMATWCAVPAMNIFLLGTKFIAAMGSLHKLAPASIEGLLRSLSYSFGDLVEFNLDHLHLGNPVWTKPFVRDVDSYFLPVPSLVVSYCIEIMENLLPPSRIQNYEHHRYEVLEAKVAELFSARFGANTVYRGSIFDPQSHENDLLCVVDNYAFVVESKSGAIPPKAKLGLELTLSKTARKLIVDSSEQALRFVDFIGKNRKPHKFRTVKNTVNQVDLTQTENAVPMGALLSPLTQAYPGWQRLLQSRLVDKVPLVCCFLLTDLGYIFHLLDSDVVLVHYLSRRQNFEQNFQYYGDEIDILNLYLDKGFPKSDGIVRNIIGYGQPLFDVYFMTRGSKVKADKPALKRNTTWLEIIRQLDRSKLPGWIDLGCALLDVDIGMQNESDAKLQQLSEMLIQQERLQADSCSWIYHDGEKQTFLILLAHKPAANVEDEIEQMSRKIASQLGDVLPVAGIIVIASLKPNDRVFSARLLTIKSRS